jgi:hypothetical protein
VQCPVRDPPADGGGDPGTGRYDETDDVTDEDDATDDESA